MGGKSENLFQLCVMGITRCACASRKKESNTKKSSFKEFFYFFHSLKQAQTISEIKKSFMYMKLFFAEKEGFEPPEV